MTRGESWINEIDGAYTPQKRPRKSKVEAPQEEPMFHCSEGHRWRGLPQCPECGKFPVPTPEPEIKPESTPEENCRKGIHVRGILKCIHCGSFVPFEQD